MAGVNRFGVSPQKEAELAALMERAGLREPDLDESFIRASGPGGQNVNKVSTAVHLRHRPSGLEVKVQKARTQGLNRFLARRMLAERLLSATTGLPTPAEQKAEKARKQKQRRSRRSRSRPA